MHFESTLSYSAHGITTVGDISPREGIPKPEKRRLCLLLLLPFLVSLELSSQRWKKGGRNDLLKNVRLMFDVQ